MKRQRDLAVLLQSGRVDAYGAPEIRQLARGSYSLMTVSPEFELTSEYLPLELSCELESGTRGDGQKTCLARHQFDYTCGTLRHIVRRVFDAD